MCTSYGRPVSKRVGAIGLMTNSLIIMKAKSRKFYRRQYKPVGSSDDEDVLLRSHAVHLREDLVDDAVGGAAGIPD